MGVKPGGLLMYRIISAALAMLFAVPVMAADILKAPEIRTVTEYGFYAWVDGSYRQVRLPSYSLGFRKIESAFDRGLIDTIDARVDGAGVSGGIGYLFPNGAVAPWLGTNLRIEGAASYVSASGTQQGGSALGRGPAVGQQLMNGLPAGVGGCGSFGEVCTTTASLATNYKSWQASGRIATDYYYGLATLTPSIAVFGGRTSNEQRFDQTLLISFLGSAAHLLATYRAT